MPSPPGYGEDEVRRDESFFGDREIELIYIARKLSEAQALEAVLTAAGVDYLVEADEYMGGFIFRRVRVGAFFYVAPEAGGLARQLMQAEGFRPYEPLK